MEEFRVKYPGKNATVVLFKMSVCEMFELIEIAPLIILELGVLFNTWKKC